MFFVVRRYCVNRKQSVAYTPLSYHFMCRYVNRSYLRIAIVHKKVTICRKKSYIRLMIVGKFGGSSLCNEKKFARAAAIAKNRKLDCVVVSAPRGIDNVTDLLVKAYFEWVKCGDCGKYFDVVADRFEKIARPLGVNVTNLLTFVKGEINAGRSYDYVVSRGEYITAKIMSVVIGYPFCDATDMIKISGEADSESTAAHVKAASFPCVVPGFYGKEPNGNVKLLPRGGSDITGALIASSLGALYEKFTDVCGIFDGYGGVIDRICYSDAKILAYYGASVLRYEAVDFLQSTGCEMRITDGVSDGTIICGEKYKVKARSKRKMFFASGESCLHAREIGEKGLKIPLLVNALNRNVMLIDDNGFSQAAIRRILKYGDQRQVIVTAYIGESDEPFDFDLCDYKLKIDFCR